MKYQSTTKPCKSFEHPRKIWEKSERIRKKVSISCNCAVLVLSIDFWLTFLKKLFKKELFGVSQSLAKSSIELYHSKKSDVLPVFLLCDMLLTGPSAAIIIELSLLVQTHDLTNYGTFLDLTLALYSRISKIAARCVRVDVIADRYFSKRNSRSSWQWRNNV